MRRGLLATTAAMALLLTSIGVVGAQGTSISPVVSGQAAACRVRNASTGRIFRRLQRAVDAARPQDRLNVKGTCIGGTTIRKKLLIVGVRTERTGKAKLSGGGKERVLAVGKGVRVELRDVEVLHGKALRGAGIHNRGLLILVDVEVRQNHARPLASAFAAGIFNRGKVRAKGSTRISFNTADAGAAGVVNEGRFVLGGSSVIAYNGGVYGSGVHNAGTFIMNGSSAIKRNWSTDAVGGVSNRGTFVMNGQSTISHNAGGTFFGGTGGADNSGTFTMNDSSAIHSNEGGGAEPGAGGVENRGKFTMSDSSSIYGNEGWCLGGGVWMTRGWFAMAGASEITGNSVEGDRSWCGDDVLGGGFHGSGGSLVGVTCAIGGRVHDNTPFDCHFE